MVSQPAGHATEHHVRVGCNTPQWLFSNAPLAQPWNICWWMSGEMLAGSSVGRWYVLHVWNGIPYDQWVHVDIVWQSGSGSGRLIRKWTSSLKPNSLLTCTPHLLYNTTLQPRHMEPHMPQPTQNSNSTRNTLRCTNIMSINQSRHTFTPKLAATIITKLGKNKKHRIHYSRLVDRLYPTESVKGTGPDYSCKLSQRIDPVLSLVLQNLIILLYWDITNPPHHITGKALFCVNIRNGWNNVYNNYFNYSYCVWLN